MCRFSPIDRKTMARLQRQFENTHRTLGAARRSIRKDADRLSPSTQELFGRLSRNSVQVGCLCLRLATMRK
jgi:hypothetical protein